MKGVTTPIMHSKFPPSPAPANLPWDAKIDCIMEEVLPELFYTCTYIYYKDGQSHWIYPLAFDGEWIQAYEWKGNTWQYTTIDFDNVEGIY